LRSVVVGQRSGQRSAYIAGERGLPASEPSLVKSSIWSEAACVVKGPGLNWKSSDPLVPEIDDVSTVTL
jgi:hypothetical protein